MVAIFCRYHSQLRSFNRVFHRLADYISDLVRNSDPLDNLENINAALSQLHRESVDLNRIYSELAVEENERNPDPNNQRLISAFASVSAGLCGLSGFIADSLPRIANLVKAQPLIDNNDDGDQREESENECKIASLTKSVDEMSENLRILEQNRDHWKLECQLLEVKFNKIRDNQHENDDDENDTRILDESKKIYEKKISALITDRLISDGKSASLLSESAALKKRLDHSEKVRSKLRSSLDECEERCKLLAEEAALTAKNYEGQLSVMTEHLANMNDTLSRQTEEIQSLKSKGKKK